MQTCNIFKYNCSLNTCRISTSIRKEKLKSALRCRFIRFYIFLSSISPIYWYTNKSTRREMNKDAMKGKSKTKSPCLTVNIVGTSNQSTPIDHCDGKVSSFQGAHGALLLFKNSNKGSCTSEFEFFKEAKLEELVMINSTNIHKQNSSNG